MIKRIAITGTLTIFILWGAALAVNSHAPIMSNVDQLKIKSLQVEVLQIQLQFQQVEQVYKQLGEQRQILFGKLKVAEDEGMRHAGADPLKFQINPETLVISEKPKPKPPQKTP